MPERKRSGGLEVVGTLRSSRAPSAAIRSEAVTFTHYDVLGVSVSATHDEVRDAYRRLALEAHPDRVAGGGTMDADDAEAVMRVVNDAWQVLGDPVRRATYDAELARLQRDGTGPRPGVRDEGDEWEDDDVDEQWPADRPSSVIAGLLPLLVLVALLALVFVFTAYAKTG